MKFTQKEFDSNLEWIIDKQLGEHKSSELFADRIFFAFINSTIEESEADKVDIYMLIDTAGNPFYVGQSVNVERRVFSHRSAAGTHDYTKKEFTYKIIDSVWASSIFARKLEFMYIVNCVLLHGIDSVHYRKYAHWCFYYQEDIDLFHQCVNNKMSFNDYQRESWSIYVNRKSEEMSARWSLY